MRRSPKDRHCDSAAALILCHGEASTATKCRFKIRLLQNVRTPVAS